MKWRERKKEVQGAVLQPTGKVGAGAEEGAGRALGGRQGRNPSIAGGRSIFHALIGGSGHSDQENGIFPCPLLKCSQFGMPTGLGREGTACLSATRKREGAESCFFSTFSAALCPLSTGPLPRALSSLSAPQAVGAALARTLPPEQVSL